MSGHNNIGPMVLKFCWPSDQWVKLLALWATTCK